MGNNMKTDNRISFRAPERLLAELSARRDAGRGESLGDTARRDLARYYSLLERARRVLRSEAGGLAPFTGDELSLIADACNGVVWDPPMFGTLAIGVADSIALDGLDAKWNVDSAALMDKINALSDSEEWALIDAIGRWWASDEASRAPALLDN